MKPCLAGFMAALLLLLGVLAVNEREHARLHADSPNTHGACSVCAVAQGQLSAPVISGTLQNVSVSVLWTVPALVSSLPSILDLSVASSRGPPVFASFV